MALTMSAASDTFIPAPGLGSGPMGYVISFDVPTGTKLIVVTVAYNSLTPLALGLTYKKTPAGGSWTPLVKVASLAAPSEVCADLWYADARSFPFYVGSNGLKVLVDDDTVDLRVVIACFTSPNSTDRYRLDSSGSWSGTDSPSHAVATSCANGAAVDVMASANNNDETARTQTLITGASYDEGAWNDSSTYVIKETAGSITFGHTRTGDYAHIVASFVPDTGVNDTVVISDLVLEDKIGLSGTEYNKNLSDEIAVTDLELLAKGHATVVDRVYVTLTVGWSN